MNDAFSRHAPAPRCAVAVAPEPLPDRPEPVRDYFQTTANFWGELYGRHDVYARTYQERYTRVLGLTESLGLPCDSPVLDIGCGPGYMAVELARRKYRVQAVDIAPAMIGRTLGRAAAAGVEDRLQAQTGDLQNLPFPDELFELVLAMGVIPWVASPRKALAEMHRVLRPGGFLIVTMANRWALHHLADPMLNPLLIPLKRGVRRVMASLGRKTHPVSRLDSRREFDRWLGDAGFEKVQSTMVGFGPISFLKREMPRGAGIYLNGMLQQLADAGTPIVRELGHGYIVLCRKPS